MKYENRGLLIETDDGRSCPRCLQEAVLPMFTIYFTGNRVRICRGCLAEMSAVIENGRPIDFLPPGPDAAP